MDRKNFAFDKTNYIIMAVGFVLVIIGFLLMTGPNCTETAFEPDIFSVRRVKVAPIVCLVGFITVLVSIARRPKDKTENNTKE